MASREVADVKAEGSAANPDRPEGLPLTESLGFLTREAPENPPGTMDALRCAFFASS